MMNFTLLVDGIERIDYQKYIDDNMLPNPTLVEQEMQSVLQLLGGKLSDEIRRLRHRGYRRGVDPVLLNADLHMEVRPWDGPVLAQELRKAGPCEFPTRITAMIDSRNGYDRGYGEVYRSVGVSKQTFRNLMSFDPTVGAERDNVLRIVFAVKPTLENAELLLRSKGFAFRPTVREDIVLRYCLVRRIHDPHQVNELLEQNGCKPLFFMS
jgi:hypothetical protein